MRRMTIRSRITPLNHKGCPKRLLRGIRRNFFRLSPCYGQVSYVLLTRAPVASRRIATPLLPLDLHVLSLSLAFILSQDQTLRCCLSLFLFFFFKKNRKGQIIEICSVLSASGNLPGPTRSVSALSLLLVVELTKELHFCSFTSFDSCTTSCLLQLFQCSLSLRRRFRQPKVLQR